jgi:hypothetical protein
MNNKQQTAVDWLQSEIDNKDMGEIPMWIYEFIAQAKEMEKQQIIDANIAGMEFIPVDPNRYQEDAEQYYNETYNQ